MKRTASALTLILAIIVSTIAGAKLVNWAGANPYPYTNCDSSFVTVSVLAPENKTYDTNSIQVTITAGAFPGVWYVGYSVDGEPFIEVAPGHPLGHTFNESVQLNQLSEGSHNIVAQATAMANNPEGKVTAYFQVYFTITKTLGPQSPSPSPTPTSTPTTSPALHQTELFPTTSVIATIASLTVIGVGLLVYFKKRKQVKLDGYE